MKKLISKIREIKSDKLLHFIAGMVIFMVLFRVFAIFMPMQCSYLISYFISILASYAKEAIYDRRMKKGVYNIKDFYAGVFGTTTALLLDLLLLIPNV
jgi:hypothetical protein